jgi:CRP-like cAMP-binding protein
MPNRTRPPLSNKLLAALPGKDYERLAPHLEAVPLEFQAVLHAEGEPIKHAYFPGAGIVSLLAVMADGSAAEVGLVGSEGVVGLAAVLGVTTTPGRSMVQLRGEGVRVKASVLKAEFKRGGALHDLLLRYTHALFTQVAQSTACMASHALDRRLCRWLLMTHDGAGGDTFEVKQEFMGLMLGVTRPVVSRAAGVLQRENLVRYSRGRVAVLDRAGLEARSCECYGSAVAEYGRVLGGGRRRAHPRAN